MGDGEKLSPQHVRAARQLETELQAHVRAASSGTGELAHLDAAALVALMAGPSGWTHAEAYRARMHPDPDTDWWASDLGVVISDTLATAPERALPTLAPAQMCAVLGITRDSLATVLRAGYRNGVLPVDRSVRPWRYDARDLHSYAVTVRAKRARAGRSRVTRPD